MDDATNQGDEQPGGMDDDRLLAACAENLARAIEQAIEPWVFGNVARIADSWRVGLADELRHETTDAAQRARGDVGPRVRALLALDVDEQRTGPLDLVRQIVPYATAVLADADVPPVVRDDYAEAAFPRDHYDLMPGAFSDLGDDVHVLGLQWGAAKAHRVLARRRAEGHIP